MQYTMMNLIDHNPEIDKTRIDIKRASFIAVIVTTRKLWGTHIISRLPRGRGRGKRLLLIQAVC